ncbi:MAG: Conserved repeat protein [Acetothermia bacterium 64_32]|nr:MAG: Conserved repeat protein [Acetothermia bacterium 64_32]
MVKEGKARPLLGWLLGVALACLPIQAVADTGDAVTATLIILGSPEEAGGGAGETECEPFCAPPIPALYSTQRADLLVDLNDDGNVDPGDILRYTVLVENFAPIPMEGVSYFTLIDPHLELLPDSPRTTLGAVESYPLGEAMTAVAARIGTLLPKEWAVLSFDARVREDTPPGVSALVGQGLVYSDTTSPVLTDDPDTPLLQDAVHIELGKPPSGTLAELPAGGPAPEPALVKLAQLTPEPEVLRVAEPDTDVEYAVAYANRGDSPAHDLWLVDVVGPYVHVQTESLVPQDARVWQVGGLQLVAARFAEVPPGGVATLSYRVPVGYTVPPEVAYLSTRAMAFALNAPFQLSDDPLTELLYDPTTVLLPYRCAGEGGWTWEEWREVVSTAPTGLLPLVLQEKDGTQHLRWILYGGDFFGDLSPHPSLRPPYWPRWALVGLVEVPFEELSGEQLGFRLAERKEPYVKDFLAEEPLFMWADYDRPLYGRVPATDAGELLWIERFNRPFCERGYLPLLAELDWAHDWDMPWLEDALIVATLGQEPEKP